MAEPVIVINAVTLTPSQAATVRIACVTMAEELKKPSSLGKEEVGKEIAEFHRALLVDIITAIDISGGA